MLSHFQNRITLPNAPLLTIDANFTRSLPPALTLHTNGRAGSPPPPDQLNLRNQSRFFHWSILTAPLTIRHVSSSSESSVISWHISSLRICHSFFPVTFL